MEKNGHPSLKAFLDNIKKPMPLGRKIRLFIRNSFPKSFPSKVAVVIRESLVADRNL